MRRQVFDYQDTLDERRGGAIREPQIGVSNYGFALKMVLPTKSGR